MKAITAKYDGTCAGCGEPIYVGDRIYWAPGEPVSHTECPSNEYDDGPDHAGEHRLAAAERSRMDAEYNAGIRDVETYRFNRDTFGEDFAAAEEIAWMYKTGEGM